MFECQYCGSGQVLINAWCVCDRHVPFKLDLQLDLCWWKRGIKSIICSYLCSLNHLVAGAETFLHHGAQLLSFKLQLLTNKIHLHGELWSTEKCTCIICTACMLFFFTTIKPLETGKSITDWTNYSIKTFKQHAFIVWKRSAQKFFSVCVHK